jgi:RIO1 family
MDHHSHSANEFNVNPRSPHMGYDPQQQQQHRPNQRDRIGNYRNSYSGRPDVYSGNPYAGFPVVERNYTRPLNPMDYSAPTFRESHEMTEAVMDGPRNNYDRLAGLSNSSGMYNDRRRAASAGPLHEYDYVRGSDVRYSGGPQSPPENYGRRVSAPDRYMEREVDRMRPNMRTPRHEARAAVVDTARQHLSQPEAELVEQALNLTTQHSNGSSSSHSRNHLTPDEQRHLEEALYAARVGDEAALQWLPRLTPQETMDLLQRASASDHLSQEELDRIERALMRYDQEYRGSDHHNHEDDRHYNNYSLPQHHHPHIMHSPPPHHFDQQDDHRQYHYPQHDMEQQQAQNYEPQGQNYERHRQDSDHQQPDDRPDRQPEQEVPIIPRPGYRPNPRFAATTSTPRRTYSGDSISLARREIERAAEANTLSREEYEELMMALGEGTSHTRDNNSLNSGTPRSDNNNESNRSHGRNAQSDDGMPELTPMPEKPQQQLPERIVSEDSMSDGDIQGIRGRDYDEQGQTKEKQEVSLPPLLAVDDAALEFMCEPSPDSDGVSQGSSHDADDNDNDDLEGENYFQQNSNEATSEILDEPRGSSPDEIEGGLESTKFSQESEVEEPDHASKEANAVLGDLDEDKGMTANENGASEADEKDGTAEPCARKGNKQSGNSSNDGEPEHGNSSQPAGEEQVSWNSRKGGDSVRPPANPNSRQNLNLSNHSQGRKSRNKPRLAAALAALPHVRQPKNEGPGSVSIEMEYSQSQFGDSFRTFGTYGSKQSTDTEDSQNKQDAANASPYSTSSQSIRGLSLLPPPPLQESSYEEDILDDADALQPDSDPLTHPDSSSTTQDSIFSHRDDQATEPNKNATNQAERLEAVDDEQDEYGLQPVDYQNNGEAPSYSENEPDPDRNDHQNSEGSVDQDNEGNINEDIVDAETDADGYNHPNSDHHEHYHMSQGHDELNTDLAAGEYRQTYSSEWARGGEPYSADDPPLDQAEEEVMPHRHSPDEYHEMQDGQDEYHEIQDGQDDLGHGQHRFNREDFGETPPRNEYYAQQRQWNDQRRPIFGQKPNRFEEEQWHQNHGRENPNVMDDRNNTDDPEREYLRQRQSSSRRLGRGETDHFDRQRRYDGTTRQRRGDDDALADVPYHVQVDQRTLRDNWADNGRAGSVSSLGESTQYSIYSAHFRGAEPYDPYRNEEYERALYEHNNWRQSHPTPLPHSMRELSNNYGGSDHTGGNFNESDQPLSPRRSQHSQRAHGFRRDPEYESEYARERPAPMETIPDHGRSDEHLSDHDQFDEDLKRALYESMQMQHNSQSLHDENFDESPPDHLNPHDPRLSSTQMEHVNRALSGSDYVDQLGHSSSDRYLDVDTPALMPDSAYARMSHAFSDVPPISHAARATDDALDLALQEAKNEEERKSLELARQLQEEEERRAGRSLQMQSASAQPLSPRTNRVGAVESTSPVRGRHPLEAQLSPSNNRPTSDQLASLRSSNPEDRRLALQESGTSLRLSRSSFVGAVHSSSPERVRHPLEASYSSLHRESVSSLQVGAVRSSSPERVRHPLEASYSSMQRESVSSLQVGAVRSSSPLRARHPLEDSYSSQGRAAQVGAVESRSPVRVRHPLEESYATSPRRQDRSSGMPQSFEDSMNQSSRSQLLDESNGSLFSSGRQNGQDDMRTSLEDSYSSQMTPNQPDRSQQLQEVEVFTPPTGDRTAALNRQSEPSRSPPSLNNQIKSSDSNMAKDSGVSPTGLGGRKQRDRRDSKMLGSVRKGVSSLMNTIKLGSSRRMVASQNASVDLPGNMPAPPIQQMDEETRLQITRAVERGLISQLTGVVKLGDDATIFHANRGTESSGFDVAIKVYKRVHGRRSAQPGDGNESQSSTSKQLLELWTMKEFRNLKRARKSGVPTPAPFLTKNNILFMQFMGLGGRSAPQLAELELRRGHKRWKPLYRQIVEAVAR